MHWVLCRCGAAVLRLSHPAWRSFPSVSAVFSCLFANMCSPSHSLPFPHPQGLAQPSTTPPGAFESLLPHFTLSLAYRPHLLWFCDGEAVPAFQQIPFPDTSPVLSQSCSAQLGVAAPGCAERWKLRNPCRAGLEEWQCHPFPRRGVLPDVALLWDTTSVFQLATSAREMLVALALPRCHPRPECTWWRWDQEPRADRVCEVLPVNACSHAFL